MLGWSRRDEEYRRARRAWLDTLTPEQRQDEADYQDYVGRVWFRSMPLFAVGWTVMLLISYLEIPLVGRAPFLLLGVSLVPGSITCPFVLCVMTKRAWLAARRRCTAVDE